MGSDDAWLDALVAVAAYGDRYKITSDLPVGGGAKNDAQRADRQRALAALRSARTGSAPQGLAMPATVTIRAILGLDKPWGAASVHRRQFFSGAWPGGGVRQGMFRLKGDPMILLLALPIIEMVALAHRHLLLFAPSNVLIRRVRASLPTLSTVAAMMAIAAGLLVAVKLVSDAVAAGAPGWLNLVVLVLAWDTFKVGWLAVVVALRNALGCCPQVHELCFAHLVAHLSGTPPLPKYPR